MMTIKPKGAEGVSLEKLQERIWFLENEATTMRDEAKRLRALMRTIRAKRAAKPAKR